MSKYLQQLVQNSDLKTVTLLSCNRKATFHENLGVFSMAMSYRSFNSNFTFLSFVVLVFFFLFFLSLLVVWVQHTELHS
jgi:ABC-type multidrug transport system permease subunit